MEIIILYIVILISAVHVLHAAKSKCSVISSYRFDCATVNGISETSCLERGCCWDKSIHHPKPEISKHKVMPPLEPPSCFFPANFSQLTGYYLSKYERRGNGFVGTLEFFGVDMNPRTIKRMSLDVWLETATRIHIKLTDADNRRYEVPILDPPPPPESAPLNQDYHFTVNHRPFGFAVIRKRTGETLVNTSIAPLIFSDQLIQMSSSLSTNFIYGLGEHEGPLLHDTNWTRLPMHNFDIGLEMENGANLYGSHPFYLSLEESGMSHGVFMLNSNAMEVYLQPRPSITWRMLGGIIDFYILLGPTPTEVIQQYADIIGKPVLPPYWALGFHLCRWGYKDLNRTTQIWQRNRDAKIPFDVMWNDMDYAEDFRDFTINHKTFRDLPKFVDKLHEIGMHYMMIFDAALDANVTRGTYPPLDKLLSTGMYIKNSSNQPLLGEVWPKVAIWPDYVNPDLFDYWSEMMADFWHRVKFDGAWIDMNEPSNLGTPGSLYGCDANRWDDPPYNPVLAGKGRLNDMTLCMNSKHAGQQLHYNVHNIYGLAMSKHTSNALKSIRRERPFVVSRSTFPGQGRYGIHWTGDVKSNFHDLAMSIPAVINFNMFGIPMVGADICGFFHNTTEELCLRWFQVGAFYPFCRNHNDRGNVEQDPAAFPRQTRNAIRSILSVRYLFLPYFYTLLFESHRLGTPAVRALFMEYPSDHYTYGMAKQFMWGSSLLVSPVVKGNVTQITAYFPKGEWFDVATLRKISVAKGGEWRTLSLPLYPKVDFELHSSTPESLGVGLHIKAGSVIPVKASSSLVTTTTESRGMPFELVIALDGERRASGALSWDDGTSVQPEVDGLVRLNFTVKPSGRSLYLIIDIVEITNNSNSLRMDLGCVFFLGIDFDPAHILINNTQVPDESISYDAGLQSLVVRNLHVNMKYPFDMRITQHPSEL